MTNAQSLLDKTKKTTVLILSLQKILSHHSRKKFTIQLSANKIQTAKLYKMTKLCRLKTPSRLLLLCLFFLMSPIPTIDLS